MNKDYAMKLNRITAGLGLSASLLSASSVWAVQMSDENFGVDVKITVQSEDDRDLGTRDGGDVNGIGVDVRPWLFGQRGDWSAYAMGQAVVASDIIETDTLESSDPELSSDSQDDSRERDKNYLAMREFWVDYAGLTDYPGEHLRLGLEAGDIEPLSLARSRTRWPDYRLCLQAMSDWMDSLGLPGLLEHSELALMACRGARYHHDAAQYGAAAFCNLFLSEDRGQDLHFPATGKRIPLQRGRVVIFDTAQPHAVINRHQDCFDPDDFPAESDCSQVFLSWELPIEQAGLARALGIDFDIDPTTAARLDQQQVWLDGAPAELCPETGRWRQIDVSILDAKAARKRQAVPA